MTVLVPQSPIAIDQISPGVRDAIHQLFVTHAWPASKCDMMLASLLRYAQVEKSAIEQKDRSVKIVIHNLLKTYRADRAMQRACCYQTLHTFVRLLCTLGILKKQIISDQPTLYLLSRDPGYRFQVSAEVLAGIDRLCDPQQTKNAKMRKKAREVKFRLLYKNSMVHVNLPTFTRTLPTSILEHIRDLIDSFHLSPLTKATLAQKITEICTNALYQEPPLGDLGDFLACASEEESPRNETTVDSISAFSERRSSSFEHERHHESTNEDKNLPNAALSSIDVYIQKDSSQKEFELESKIGEPWTGSEEELAQEAVRYLRLLDGPEYATPDYLKTHAGKKALGGYKNKIRRSPLLARIAAINALLQRTFYDVTKQKKPLENAGRWFHSSFDRYADQQRPMKITAKILDWAKSSYTLEEIAHVIPRERRRQETQWWSSERLHLPFASCIALHHHLPDKVHGSLPEENQGVAEAYLHAEGPSGLPNFGGMNRVEAGHVADEIRQEASWYLERIQVSPKGEHVYVVKAYIADTLFPVTYPTRQDWFEEHQHQVRHRIREQQREEIYAAHS